MKKILIVAMFCSLFPVQIFAQPLPGSVGDAIATDESFSFPEQNSSPEEPVPAADEFFRGKVTGVKSEHEEAPYGSESEVLIQELEVTITEGSEKNNSIEVINEIPLAEKEARAFKAGDNVVVGKTEVGDGIQYYVSDVYRLNALWLVSIIFIVITLIFTRFQGIRAFAGLIASFLVITWFIVPQIIDGHNPIMISMIGTAIIAATSLYIAHGFHARTSVALVGTMISISIAVILSYVFVTATRLFGLGSEEAFYLQFAPGAAINLRGLLLGGIIIGVMGILDDITTAQTAVVEQIYHANPKLTAKELYQRASIVGREHILSLVNTLVLAYTGASLPLILIFKIYERPAWVTLNSEIIMEEVIRTLIGSITLIIAVPITTFIAAEYYYRKKPKVEGKKHIHVH